MTTTTTLIAKQTVGSGGASSVTFSDIPQTYTDLKVVISVRTTNTLYGETIRIKPNGLSTNGSAIIFRGYGSGISSYTYSNALATNNSLGNGATANTFASIEVYCPNYTSSDYKSFSADSVSENNDTNGRQELTASLWSSTAAITSLVFDNDASFGFTEFSTFYLYGISNSTTTQNATAPYASGGDVITTDGTYWYHTFLYSGTFTPLKNLTCDYLVVAGGGGGGTRRGGGGGAGGYRTSIGGTALSLTAQAYTATVGAGGAGSTQSPDRGAKGSNSVFSTITSTGGGYGTDAVVGYAAGNGGSGGGAGGGAPAPSPDNNGGSGNEGGYTPVEGYAGGNSTDANQRVSGGGGGASAVGGSFSGSTSGSGGAGASNSISGTSVTYAGGGGGGAFSGNTAGAGGAGGGGAGSVGTAQPTAGTANRGGGGGGGGLGSSGTDPLGGNGGSGIIVLRYAV
jgi:hypothetical protein